MNSRTRHVHAPRIVAAAIVAVLAATIVATPVSAASPAPSTAAKRLAGRGIVFGAHIRDNGPGYLVEAHKRFESRVGHKVRAARVYYEWDSQFPSEYINWLKRNHRTVVMSIKSRRSNGSVISWRDIANAGPHSGLYATMESWARRIKAFGKHVYLIFNHEPEAYKSDAMGTSDAFVAAWRKIVSVFRKRDVRNVSWTWTMTDWAFAAKTEQAANKWYPGDNYVDVIGADVYNFNYCGGGSPGWRSFESKMRPIRAWAKQHPGKPIILPEWASTEDPTSPGRKAEWIRQARALLKRPAWRRVKMLLYFHAMDTSHANCNWPTTSTGSSLSAFKEMADDPYFDKVG